MDAIAKWMVRQPMPCHRMHPSPSKAKRQKRHTWHFDEVLEATAYPCTVRFRSLGNQSLLCLP